MKLPKLRREHLVKLLAEATGPSWFRFPEEKSKKTVAR